VPSNLRPAAIVIVVRSVRVELIFIFVVVLCHSRSYLHIHALNSTSAMPPSRYAVSAVLAHRIVDDQVQYCVQWAGYPLSQRDWIPVSFFINGSRARMVRQFHAAQRRLDRRIAVHIRKRSSRTTKSSQLTRHHSVTAATYCSVHDDNDDNMPLLLATDLLDQIPLAQLMRWSGSAVDSTSLPTVFAAPAAHIAV